MVPSRDFSAWMAYWLYVSPLHQSFPHVPLVWNFVGAIGFTQWAIHVIAILRGAEQGLFAGFPIVWRFAFRRLQHALVDQALAIQFIHGPIRCAAFHQRFFGREDIVMHAEQIDAGATDHERPSFGRLVGNIVIRATGFPVTRTVDTGSWIIRSAQGRGLGRRARAMALALAFDLLDAKCATTECAAWNEGSRRVTESLGYQPQGSSIQDWGGEAVTVLAYSLTPEQFVRPAHDITVTSASDVRRQLGIDER